MPTGTLALRPWNRRLNAGAMVMNVDPATQEFRGAVAASGPPPIYTFTLDVARKMRNCPQAEPDSAPALDIEERTIPVMARQTHHRRIVRGRPRSPTKG